MYMIQKKKRNGVSPVVGVILMVAITVIIAAVVANFVLDLGNQLGQDADATLNFEQSISDFGNEYYNVTVTVSDMQSSDYLVVTTAGASNGYEFDTDYSGDTDGNGDITGDESGNNAPDSTNPENSQSVGQSGGGAILYRSGDRVTVTSDSTNLEAGDTIQVFGAISGEENLVQSYNVQDTLG